MGKQTEEDQTDPVKPYDPAIHGPLKPRHFAISRGDKWEAFTEAGELVYLPADHEMVRNYLEYGKAMSALRGELKKAW